MSSLPAPAREWALTKEAFDGLLAWLDADPHEAARKYEQIRRSLIRFFETRRCATPGDQADKVIDRVARRLAEGADIYVTDHNHRFDDPDTPIARQWVNEAPVVIGAGSWLGAGVVVLPGTTLGRNVVVGAGSVVKGEFPDRSVIAGVPAKVVRRPPPDHVPSGT